MADLAGRTGPPALGMDPGARSFAFHATRGAGARLAYITRSPAWQFARRPAVAVTGLALLLVLLTAVLAPHLAPFSPKRAEFASLRSPGAEFLFGTDRVGRDVLSRLIWGARLTVYVGLASAAIGVTLGTILAMVTGYFGGYADTLSQRGVDMLMALPPILLALSVTATLGPSVNNVIAALILLLAPTAARTLRPLVLSLKETPFIEASRAIGCSPQRIICRHIAPNCVAPYTVLFTVNMAYAVVVEAALSFLGVGVPPDEPSWGGMLSAGVQDMTRAPWLVFFPGLAIFITVLALNVLGDSIRDFLDPRVRRNLR